MQREAPLSLARERREGEGACSAHRPITGEGEVERRRGAADGET